jgi:hypothetical protein
MEKGYQVGVIPRIARMIATHKNVCPTIPLRLGNSCPQVHSGRRVFLNAHVNLFGGLIFINAMIFSNNGNGRGEATSPLQICMHLPPTILRHVSTSFHRQKPRNFSIYRFYHFLINISFKKRNIVIIS